MALCEYLIPVADGAIVLMSSAETFSAKGKIQYSVEDYGLKVEVSTNTFPVPAAVVSHLIGNGQTLYLYSFEPDLYVSEFVATVTLDRDSLLKMLGVWEARQAS